ncbi:MAG: SDR family NAD(P)-dependent oxidoreductase [Kiloniellales bacterium]|nr:SDR family NAD(P)-dependent oxidoreductase [Kiloniellales bacterium]
MSFAGRAVWITGASSGIGLEVATQLLGQGARVFGSARSAEPLQALADEQAGFTAIPLDVSDSAAVGRAQEEIVEQAGKIDIAILNAAVYAPGPTRDLSAAEMQRHLDVNVMGVVYALEALLPLFERQGHGRVAIVASVAGYRGLPQAGVYGATKAALINLAESLRAELSGSGITVQVVNPGFVDTPMTQKNEFAMPLIITPRRAAEKIVAGLASDRFEIAFPWLFVIWLKLLRLLPYGLYFPLVRRLTGERS